jgi:hypothetical protein
MLASFHFADFANGSTAPMRFQRWRDDPVDLIPVIIFLDIREKVRHSIGEKNRKTTYPR